MTVAALRQLLDQIDLEGGPELARRTRPLSTNPKDRTMTAVPTTASAPVSLHEAAEKLPVGQLLAWGDNHPDTNVRDAATRARAALVGLRARYVTDHELAELDSEQAALEERLATLAARKAELAPPKARKVRKPLDYNAAEVRAWARAQGVECPPVGRIPKAVVEQWRAAPTLEQQP
ncbi:histone-like nucleoid-structuring protein Lsr2 [Streptomyces sp. NPDC050264]|uniref:Lsr2 family DNA-binding protein n=1 Tax=Streptomyces sp. NPDC050264 TaxID=3155038 RepID=UPI00341C1963